LYCEKVGLAAARTAGEAAAWGHRHEPTMRAWYEAETGRTVVPGHTLAEADAADMCPAATIERVTDSDGERTYLRSREHPFMLANVDGFAFDDSRGSWGLLEIKTTGDGSQYDGGVPPDVYAQIQHYLAVTGLKWAACAVLIRGNRGGHVDVERDEPYISALVEAEAEMWRRIQNADPPDPDTSESSERALREIYSQSSGEVIDLGDEADALIATIDEAKATLDAAREIKRSAEARMRALMGAAAIGRTPDGGEVKRVDVRERHVEAYTAKAYSYLKIKPRK
jgi:predicted phage-related endonuclease